MKSLQFPVSHTKPLGALAKLDFESPSLSCKYSKPSCVPQTW